MSNRISRAAALSAASLLALTLSGAACADPGDIVDEVSSFQADFVIETVAEDLEFPWSIAFLPDGRMLVTERPGRIRIVDADGTLSDPLDHGLDVLARNQGGMLGISLDPNFAENGYIYFCFVTGEASASYDALARAKLENDALSDVEVIWEADSVARSNGHFGGRIVWGHDGKLFLTLGERQLHSDQAQDPHNHFGTVVRLNPDGSPAEDNPFADGEDGRPDVWSYGHRNQQGAFVHPETGALWTHEHGARGGDEINIVRAGVNHGWPEITYGINYNGQPISDHQEMEGMAEPIWYWQPSIAPSGMTYYQGEAFPRWQGDIFAGGLAGAVLHRFEVDGERIIGMEPLLTDLGERIRDVQTGPDGFVYVLTDNNDGRVLRLRPAE